MHLVLISGWLMVVLGTILTIIPVIRLAVGPLLFALGGLTCVAYYSLS